MPIYEYECAKCHRRTSVLTTRVSETVEPVCRHCGSRKLDRLMSRFAMPKSEDQRMEALADPANFGDLDENDPRSVARAMRRLGKEMGEEFSEEDFDAAIEEMESGGLDGDEGEDSSGSDDDL
jgi:putative FmdB family regulatory protein